MVEGAPLETGLARKSHRGSNPLSSGLESNEKISDNICC